MVDLRFGSLKLRVNTHTVLLLDAFCLFQRFLSRFLARFQRLSVGGSEAVLSLGASCVASLLESKGAVSTLRRSVL